MNIFLFGNDNSLHLQFRMCRKTWILIASTQKIFIIHQTFSKSASTHFKFWWISTRLCCIVSSPGGIHQKLPKYRRFKQQTVALPSPSPFSLFGGSGASFVWPFPWLDPDTLQQREQSPRPRLHPALSSVLISRDCGCDVAALNISQPKLPAFETQSHPDTWPQLQPPVLALAVSSGAACVTSSSTRWFSLHKSAPRQDILIKYSLHINTKICYIYIKLG